MDARDSTTANAELWTAYLRDQWRAWLDPFGLGQASDDTARVIAEATAAGIASVIAAFIAPPIRRMYADNAPAVTRFVAETGAVGDTPTEDAVIPPDFARRPAGDSQREEWRPAYQPREEAILAY